MWTVEIVLNNEQKHTSRMFDFAYKQICPNAGQGVPIW